MGTCLNNQIEMITDIANIKSPFPGDNNNKPNIFLINSNKPNFETEKAVFSPTSDAPDISHSAAKAQEKIHEHHLFS